MRLAPVDRGPSARLVNQLSLLVFLHEVGRGVDRLLDLDGGCSQHAVLLLVVGSESIPDFVHLVCVVLHGVGRSLVDGRVIEKV